MEVGRFAWRLEVESGNYRPIGLVARRMCDESHTNIDGCPCADSCACIHTGPDADCDFDRYHHATILADCSFARSPYANVSTHVHSHADAADTANYVAG